MMPEKTRIEWIDSAKAIGIFLVIIGHTMIDPWLRGQIFAFHMPLFFLISGMVFSNKKTFKNFLISKSKTLLIPYFAFSVIAVILIKLLINQHVDHFIKMMLLSKRNQIQYDQPLWFLTSLFTIEIIFYFISKYFKNKYLILFIALAIGYFSTAKLGTFSATKILPWSLDQSLLYISFFGLGYFFKQTGLIYKDVRKSISFIILSIFYVGSLFNNYLYVKVWDIVKLPIDLTFMKYYAWAVLGIVFVLYVSQYLSILKLIGFFGKNTLSLFALHGCLGFNLYNLYLAKRINHHIGDPTLLGIVITIFCMLALTPVILLINKYLPFILGKKLNFKRGQGIDQKMAG